MKKKDQDFFIYTLVSRDSIFSRENPRIERDIAPSISTVLCTVRVSRARLVVCLELSASTKLYDNNTRSRDGGLIGDGREFWL